MPRNFTQCYNVVAGTTTPTDMAVQNSNGRKGMLLTIDITAGTSLSITVTIVGIDPVSGKTYTILASAALTGVGTTILKVYPGLTAAGNLVANDIIPAAWKVTVAHGNSNAATYKIGAQLIP